jgi:LCP family protein required for cell wall assembly
VVGSLRKPFGGKSRVNILVLGLDDGQGGQGRSDTMLLVHVDPGARRLAALSIPRDTRVPLGDGRFAKINAAHARGGPRLAARAVSDLTGLPVDYTLSTDFAGFSRLVDLVGGIDLDVERPMDYVDHWGHLEIHLKAGPQHLDGSKAIQYVRFRKSGGHGGLGDGSDISRIARQQKFLEALAARCFLGTNLVRLPEIVREGRREIRTDLASPDLLWVAGLAKEIGADRLKLLTVPGTTAIIGGQSYWLVSENDLPAVLRQFAGAGAPASNTVALGRDDRTDWAMPDRG